MKPYIIAEIGSNHNGSLKNAYKLIDVAKNSGANAVKFQLFKYYEFMGLSKKNYKELKKNELPKKWLKKIEVYCNAKKIELFFSVFGKTSLKMLSVLKSVKTVKIASSECTNLNLLSLIAKKFDKIILSTGMSFESDIVKAKEILELHGAKKIIVMHCVANYPTKIKEMNLNYLNTLKNLNFFKIGLSDHSLNDISSIVSIGLGACYFEKHITLNKKDLGPDNFYSYLPHEFKQYVKSLKNAYISLGKNRKIISSSEKKFGRRKGIYALRNLKKGEILKKTYITTKIPNLGIRDIYLDSILGKKIKKSVSKNKPIFIENIE
tara:strand:- start:1415 stop:2377 length:963 start_codon:yes stop_codon:yes gene_type:complete